MTFAKHARNVAVAGLAAATLALTWTAAEARPFHHGGYYRGGGWGWGGPVLAAGLLGGLAFGAWGNPYYGRGYYGGGYYPAAYGYGNGYGYGGNCWVERRAVWRGHYRVIKNVRVCN